MLSVQLIRRLVTRFRDHVETMYLSGETAGLSENATAGDTLLQKGRICGLRAPIAPTVKATYNRDVQAFLEYRQILPLLLRAYNFPPFTLTRLCELIIEQPTASTWSHNFWKWSHAVLRNLKGIVSPAKQNPQSQDCCPKISKEVSRRLKKTVFCQDTPVSLDGFRRLNLSFLDAGMEDQSPTLAFKTPCQSPVRAVTAFSTPAPKQDNKKRSSEENWASEVEELARKRRITSVGLDGTTNSVIEPEPPAAS
eukprot:Blabericola_migrator_1__4668@NODE_246_length_10907_cov_93_324631_g208_i0_p4_GENE_NODE_246_length_10907_cov_93_324631_g208_i0NODE_246_length_10907_cov_93_324631_g208_i0_p4_ORF_typecomplete_len252_score36_40PPP4R2/PF09184_11/1_5e06ESCRTII/PF05871_12/1ESCRTII/PF05871_12/3_6e02_NODE_246_length_10907_cov_93_324631_g208_i0951810273